MGIKPSISKKVYIAPGAQIIGNVELQEGASVWHNTVLRGDMAKIVVGRGSNVQDNCTFHCELNKPLIVGDGVTIGHNAVLHSCTVGDCSLIGMGAIVLNGAKIGSGCLIAAGAVVTPNTVVPDGSLYMGSPAKLKRMLSEDEKASLRENAAEYMRLGTEYKMQMAALNVKKCVLTKGLTQSRLDTIRDLEGICKNNESVHLKLNWSMLEHRDPREANDIFYYDNGVTIGYLGIYCFSKAAREYEITGMVNPDCRRQGIFSAMLGEAERECRRRGAKKLSLVMDSNSASGQEFIRTSGYKLEHTEYSMRLERGQWNTAGEIYLTFRKASLRDAKELAFIDSMCFECPMNEAASYYEEGLNGDFYIAQIDGKPVGKVGITEEHDGGYICGLAVVPGSRGHGFGREILSFALDRIFERLHDAAILEVDTDNKTAISLYKSTGFNTVATFNYYEKIL